MLLKYFVHCYDGHDTNECRSVDRMENIAMEYSCLIFKNSALFASSLNFKVHEITARFGLIYLYCLFRMFNNI